MLKPFTPPQAQKAFLRGDSIKTQVYIDSQKASNDHRMVNLWSKKHGQSNVPKTHPKTA
jgi:hypothetical protein